MQKILKKNACFESTHFFFITTLFMALFIMISDISINFARKEAHRFRLKVGVFLLLIEHNNILLLRRYQTGIDDGCYVVPMGSIDGDERVSEALIREVREEANIILKPQDMRVCHVMHRLHTMPDGYSFEQIDVFFKASAYEGIIKNLEPHKCDELQFFPLDNLPEKTVPAIRHAISCSVEGRFFSEFGWDDHA